MYDEQIKQLRDKAGAFDYEGRPDIACDYEQAANVIEELTKDRDNWKVTAKEEREMYWHWFDNYQRDVPRWIPVTERLPDTMKDKSVYSGWSAEIAPSDDVLCYLGNEKRQTVAWYSHTYNEWTTVDENTVYKYEEVTHWQPLPEPPKEET